MARAVASLARQDRPRREPAHVSAPNGTSAAAPSKFLRFRAVHERTGLSRSTIWRLERVGAFPRHRRLSANAVGWVEEEIDGWMLSRAAA